jgi:hypothetical protein
MLYPDKIMDKKTIILGSIILVLLVVVAVFIFTRHGTGPEVVNLQKQKDSLLSAIKNNDIKLDSLRIADAVKDSIIAHKEVNITNIYEKGKQDYINVLSLDAGKSVVLWADRIARERATNNGH